MINHFVKFVDADDTIIAKEKLSFILFLFLQAVFLY